MGIGATFFTPCSPQNKAPQGGAPRRDGLRPSPWLRHGPCGASHRQTYPHKNPTHGFPQVGFFCYPGLVGRPPSPHLNGVQDLFKHFALRTDAKSY